MNNLTKITVLAVTLGLLGGCAAPGEYQYGDLTKKVRTRQAAYCLETNPADRALRVAALRALGADIPTSGACTDITSMLEPGELLDLEIDVEQAEEDRRRFEEMYGEGIDEQ